MKRKEPQVLEASVLSRLEGRHRAIGDNALRAAVLGANDGLLSNLSLVMGVAGAHLSNASVLVSGIAGLLAGAFSMAIGEWVSVQSSRELHQCQLAVEADERAIAPAELGGSPWEAAWASFFLFAAGALVPVMPFLIWHGIMAMRVSLVASAVGLFGIGAVITLVTGRSIWMSGARQLLFGLAAAAVTYGIGQIVGTHLGS